MSAYVVVEIAVHDPATYERYKPLAAASVQAHGGRYIVRGGACEVLEGDWKPPRLVILEFPTAQQARRWWASTDYAEAKAMRQASAHTRMLLLEGSADPRG